MLVLSRKTNETVVIGEDVRVTVIRVDGDKVRIGIAAPANIRVDREEIARKRRAVALTAGSLRGPE